jgi:hypothetical protein
MFGKNNMMTSTAHFTADDNAKLALQTLLFAELRQASKARGERAKMTAAIFAAIAIGSLIAALNCAVPFLPH